MINNDAYEVVQGKTREDAIESSKYEVGQLLRVTDLRAYPGKGGQWSVWPVFEVVPEDELDPPEFGTIIR